MAALLAAPRIRPCPAVPLPSILLAPFKALIESFLQGAAPPLSDALRSLLTSHRSRLLLPLRKVLVLVLLIRSKQDE